MYFFGWYWLANPDVYRITGDQTSICVANASSGVVFTNYTSKDAVPYGLINVTENFETWFEWGFIMQAFGMIGGIIGLGGALAKNRALLEIFHALTIIFNCCGFLAWFIAA